MLLSAVFWWGFDLPLAWLATATLLPILAAAWLVTEELHASCLPQHLPRGRAGLGEEAVDKAGPVLLQLCAPG